MVKDIRYSGFATVPSDYDCPDGQLAASWGLILEDGGLRPIAPPTQILDCNLGGIVKMIHHTPGDDYYIIARPDGSDAKLYALLRSSSVTDESSAVLIATIPGVSDPRALSVTAVGNTLIAASPQGLIYILFKDGAYSCLGSRPPFVTLTFGLTQVDTLGNSDLTLEGPLFKVGRSTLDGLTKEQVAERSNAVLGYLLSEVAEKVTSKGLFYQPFFVRYAYRLYDGSHAWHSSPVLMLPTVIRPLLEVVARNGDAISNASPWNSDGSHEVTVKGDHVGCFALDYRIVADASISSLGLWKDIVAGIDVFVSAPIYTFDQNSSVGLLGYSNAALLNSYYDWNPDGLDLRSGSVSAPSSVFVGHYSVWPTRGSGTQGGNSSSFVDHSMSTSSTDAFPIFPLSLNEKFHDQIKSVSNFYRVAFLETDKIQPTDVFKRLQLEQSNLEALAAKPALADDYMSHRPLVADSLFAYNSRLHLSGCSVSPASPLPLLSAVAFASPVGPPGYVKVTVYTRINGVRCYAVNLGSDDSSLYDIANCFPRYIFYPDASAYKMTFECGSVKVSVDLVPHDFLNGAYFYGTFALDSMPESASHEAEVNLFSAVPVGNKVYVSDVNNPFVFPAANVVSVGNGIVLRLSCAAKALSQGQFGQFPLYAFCSDGVWALEVSSTGTYSARQPITRDVCINPAAITQIDDAVLFPTVRGIMLLSGSNSQCISDDINSDSPFNPSSLPGLGSVSASMGAVPPVVPLSSFVAGCGMSYDYPGQRIIVFNPSCHYAYVFSLKSKLWGMVAADIDYAVNAYPDAVCASPDGLILDYSSPDVSAAMNGLLVSRPIKLDSPDILKTVDAVIQRGFFRKGSVRCALYGSRDLLSWHYLCSSKDHCLRRHRGSPYKYFRVVCLSSLAHDESIYGTSFSFYSRYTNRIR